MTLRKRRVWLEKAIEKLEKAGIEILWIRPLYPPKDIIPCFVLIVKTETTMLTLRVYNRSSWKIDNTYNTIYKTTLEECIKEIEGGKD